MAAKGGRRSLQLAERMSADHTSLCGELISSTVKFPSSFLRRAITAEKAADKIANMTTTRHPRIRYSLGPDAAFTLPLNRLLPDRLMDRVFSPLARRGKIGMAHL